MSRFYNFINNGDSTELYVYGALTSEKWSESDVDFLDFKNAIDKISDGGKLNIFINSPGGEVFVCQSAISLLKRAKVGKNININAYIDGLGASCASWLPMIADDIFIYKGSIMMLHKPMVSLFGANADEMKKEIELLDKIENTEMIPMYMSKAKEGVSEETIKGLLAAETWLDYNEIQKYFNVTLLEGNKQMVAKLPNKFMNMYNNVPQELLNQSSEVEDMQEVENTKPVEEIVDETETTEVETTEEVEETVETETIETEVESEVEDVVEESVEETTEVEITETIEDAVDEKDVKIAELENAIETLKNENTSLEEKLDEANKKVIALNDKVAELQPIVDKYNDKLAKEEEEKNAQLVNEKKEYYKNKFEQLGARAKFESEEVQNLISNCIKDDKSMSKLDSMLVGLISVENSKPKEKFERVSDVDNLLEIEETVMSKYGFK